MNELQKSEAQTQAANGGSLHPAGSVVKADSEHNKTRKIMVITINRRDFELLEEMLANGLEKLPDLEMDGVVSAIVADACRFHRNPNPPNDKLRHGE